MQAVARVGDTEKDQSKLFWVEKALNSSAKGQGPWFRFVM